MCVYTYIYIYMDMYAHVYVVRMHSYSAWIAGYICTYINMSSIPSILAEQSTGTKQHSKRVQA